MITEDGDENGDEDGDEDGDELEDEEEKECAGFVYDPREKLTRRRPRGHSSHHHRHRGASIRRIDQPVLYYPAERPFSFDKILASLLFSLRTAGNTNCECYFSNNKKTKKKREKNT